MWCAWMLIHTPLRFPGPNPEAGRFLAGFLAAGYLVLTFMGLRFRAWIMAGLCLLGTLACVGLLLTQINA